MKLITTFLNKRLPQYRRTRSADFLRQFLRDHKLARQGRIESHNAIKGFIGRVSLLQQWWRRGKIVFRERTLRMVKMYEHMETTCVSKRLVTGFYGIGRRKNAMIDKAILKKLPQAEQHKSRTKKTKVKRASVDYKRAQCQKILVSALQQHTDKVRCWREALWPTLLHLVEENNPRLSRSEVRNLAGQIKAKGQSYCYCRAHLQQSIPLEQKPFFRCPKISQQQILAKLSQDNPSNLPKIETNRRVTLHPSNSKIETSRRGTL